MQISLRQASAADAPILANLCLLVQHMHIAAHPKIFKPIPPDDPDLINFYVEHFNEGYIAYLAEIENEGKTDVVGFFFGQFVNRPENLFTYAASRFHIDQMGVHEVYQNQGIGKLLMKKAFEIARDGSAQRLSLGVWAFNAGAKAFYDATGFEVAYHTMFAELTKE